MSTKPITIDLTGGLICASVQSSEDLWSLVTEPCSGNRCTWFKNRRCTAVKETADDYRRWYLPADAVLPSCTIADKCRWNMDAIKNGDRACPPRSLGLLCQHQQNENNADIAIWNTFEMADPDDEEIWGQPQP